MEWLGYLVAFFGGFGVMGLAAQSGRSSLEGECQAHIEAMNKKHLDDLAKMEELHKREIERIKRQRGAKRGANA